MDAHCHRIVIVSFAGNIQNRLGIYDILSLENSLLVSKRLDVKKMQTFLTGQRLRNLEKLSGKKNSFWFQ